MASKLSKLETFALIIGVAGGIAAIPRAVYEGWTTFMGSAQVSVLPTEPLRLTYDSTTKMVSFSFGAVLHNAGIKSERLTDAYAVFHSASQPPREHSVSALAITMRDGDAKVPLALPIARESFRPFSCEISSYLSTELEEVLMAKDSARHFKVTFVGEAGTYAVDFQFDLSNEVLILLLKPSDSPRTVRFIGSNLQ